MPWSTNPNTFGEHFADLLIKMATKPKFLRIRTPKSTALRLQFYAFRRAWKAEADQALKRKDQASYRLAREQYDVLARYQCFAYNGFVEWVHVSTMTAEIEVGPPVENDFPIFRSPGLDDLLALPPAPIVDGNTDMDKMFEVKPPTVVSRIMICGACGQEHDVDFICDAIKDQEALAKAEEQLKAEWRIERDKGETKTFYEWKESRSLDNLINPEP